MECSVAWSGPIVFPFPKSPLKSPLSKGGRIFIERGDARQHEKLPLALVVVCCPGQKIAR